MSAKNFKMRFSLFMLLSVMVSVAPTFGASAVVGSVAGSTNATVGGHVLIPNTTLFSGDNLRVNNGAAVVAMGMGSRMVFGRDTMASLERTPAEVTAVLGQGNISLYHPEAGMALRVKVGEISVSAEKGYKTLGDVAMVNGFIIVTAKEGMLRVQAPQRAIELTKGKTIAIKQEAAGSPRPQDMDGSSSSHITQGEVVAIATLGGVAADVVMSVLIVGRNGDLKVLSGLTSASAAKADQDAIAATTAANAAAAKAEAARLAAVAANNAAVTACQTVSPTATTCGSLM